MESRDLKLAWLLNDRVQCQFKLSLFLPGEGVSNNMNKKQGINGKDQACSVDF